MPYSSVRLCSRAVTQVGLSADLFSTSSSSSHVICQRVTLPPPQPIASAWLTCRVYSTVSWRAGAWCRPQHHCRPLALSLSALAHKHCSSLTLCDREQADPPPALEPLCSSDDAASVGGCDSDAEDLLFETPINQLDIEKLYVALHCADDEDMRRKVDLILLEYNCLMLDNQLTPTFLRRKDWQELLLMDSSRQRSIYFTFIAKNESSRQNRKARKLLEQQKRSEELDRKKEEAERSGAPMAYSLSDNALFLRFYKSHIKRWQAMRMWQALLHGPHIVFDLGYEQMMNRREIRNTCKQMMLSFAENMMSLNPFCFHLCNVNARSYQYDCLKTFMPTCTDTSFPMYIHSSHYTELFDRKRLVYLTPHCLEDLQSFDEDDIYIIGGLVDLTNTQKHSLARAKRDNIRMARLPLKKYLEVCEGFRPLLTLNNVTEVMLALSAGKSWPDALVSVPERRRVLQSKLEREKMLRLVEEGGWKKRAVIDRYQYQQSQIRE